MHVSTLLMRVVISIFSGNLFFPWIKKSILFFSLLYIKTLYIHVVCYFVALMLSITLYIWTFQLKAFKREMKVPVFTMWWRLLIRWWFPHRQQSLISPRLTQEFSRSPLNQLTFVTGHLIKVVAPIPSNHKDYLKSVVFKDSYTLIGRFGKWWSG